MQEEPYQNRNTTRTWHEEHAGSLTFGDRIADAAANFIGSWRFIIVQTVLMTLWVIYNTTILYRLLDGQPFDPYPFVFLNLFMSAEAAYSTPLVMMNQNRQADRDRHQAQADYKTNIESERRIEELQQRLARIEERKLDALLAYHHIEVPIE